MWIGLDDLHAADREVLKHPQADAVVDIGFSQDLLPSTRECMSEKYRIIRLIQGPNVTIQNERTSAADVMAERVVYHAPVESAISRGKRWLSPTLVVGIHH
jgi:hypothetical protein